MVNATQAKDGLEPRRRAAVWSLVALSSLVLLTVAPLAASTDDGPFLEVRPGTPEDDEIVRFFLSGTWNTTCTPKFSHGEVGNNLIEIFYATGTRCGRAFTDYEEEVRTKEPLTAGYWLVRAVIDGKVRTQRKFKVAPAKHGAETTVQFRSKRVSFDEDSHTAFVTVERTGSFHGEVSVDYRTSDDTAFAGQDYEYTQGTLMWRDGDRSPKTVSIRLFDDFEFEGDETFWVFLDHASGGALGEVRQAQVELVDDERDQGGGACRADSTTLCLQNGRFEVTLHWRTQQGKKGQGNQGAFTDETGYFWFFSNKNIEVLVKILDGCSLNDSYWVYVAGLTNIWVEVAIRDTETGEVKTWTNPMGQSFRPIEDTGYFDCRPE